MARALIVGSGIGGMCAGLLLRRDGHDVTVLERDPAPPPADPRDAWTGWERRGINQFRLPHFFQAAFRRMLDAELPDVSAALRAAGALELDIIGRIPAEITGGPRPGDEHLVALTGRRPTVEAALANAVEASALDVRRGTAVAGLLAGGAGAVPRVTGVRTEAGEELHADVVIDASGRRSPLPQWLDAIGAAPPDVEAADLGFAYYGRHLRSADGSTPPSFGPLLQPIGSISILTLPADNGTWCLAIIAAGNDAPLRAVRDPEVWARVIASCPLVAHWLDGEFLDDGVAVMAKIEDRHRSLMVDGAPVATGVLALADSWACTNPSVGRGATLALMHSLALRDVVRAVGVDDAEALSRAFHDATLATVQPWYEATVAFDRDRMSEVQAHRTGTTATTSETYDVTQSLAYAMIQDPDLLRVGLHSIGMLGSPDPTSLDPAVLRRIRSLGGSWRANPLPGPTRDELLALVGN